MITVKSYNLQGFHALFSCLIPTNVIFLCLRVKKNKSKHDYYHSDAVRSPVANYHVPLETHSGKWKNPLSLQNHSSSQTPRILSSASKFTSCSGLLGFDRCLSSQLSFLYAVCPKQEYIPFSIRVLFYFWDVCLIFLNSGGGMLTCILSIVGPIQKVSYYTSQANQLLFV